MIILISLGSIINQLTHICCEYLTIIYFMFQLNASLSVFLVVVG